MMLKSTSECSCVQGLQDLLLFAEQEHRQRGGVEPDARAILRAAQDQGRRWDNSISVAGFNEELLEKMACQQAALANKEAPEPRANTIRWYQQHPNALVAEGSTVTVSQASYCLAWLKLKGSMTCECLDYICKMLAYGGFLKSSKNIMPRYVADVLVAGCVLLRFASI